VKNAKNIRTRNREAHQLTTEKREKSTPWKAPVREEKKTIEKVVQRTKRGNKERERNKYPRAIPKRNKKKKVRYLQCPSPEPPNPARKTTRTQLRVPKGGQEEGLTLTPL